MTGGENKQLAKGLRAAIISLISNGVFVVIKVTGGILGNSYALIADGIESAMDIISSIIVYSGLRISVLPPDKSHHYGHGKAEPLAGMMVSMLLMAAAIGICIQSIDRIQNPQGAPEAFTLIILAVVVAGKELMFRFLKRTGKEIDSTAIKTDAWHHRSDALTSIAASIGITVALIGGEGYETADAWAALVACAVIGFNGIRLFSSAMEEVMDAAPSAEHLKKIRTCARGVEHVQDIHHCHVRKSGLLWLVDVHVLVSGDKTVHEGHEIGHRVRAKLIESDLHVRDVLVHVEPFEELGLETQTDS